MAKKNYTEIQNEVVAKYCVTLDPHSTCWSRTHAHVKERRVCKWKQANSIESTFTLLHEIGHLETTKSKMRRCESEYYATEWAIDRCVEYGLEIPAKVIQDYQDYIDMERDRGVRRGGQNLPSFKLHVPADHLKESASKIPEAMHSIKKPSKPFKWRVGFKIDGEWTYHVLSDQNAVMCVVAAHMDVSDKISINKCFDKFKL